MYECVSVSSFSVCVWAMSPITRDWAWECVECRVTSMVTFPEPQVPGQQLRMTCPREEVEESEKERVRRVERVGGSRGKDEIGEKVWELEEVEEIAERRKKKKRGEMEGLKADNYRSEKTARMGWGEQKEGGNKEETLLAKKKKWECKGWGEKGQWAEKQNKKRKKAEGEEKEERVEEGGQRQPGGSGHLSCI